VIEAAAGLRVCSMLIALGPPRLITGVSGDTELKV
jgi:hypothetical protein